MVSVRRPTSSHRSKSSSSLASKLFTFRNVLLAFIAFQSLNLLRKIAHHSTTKPSSSSSSSSTHPNNKHMPGQQNNNKVDKKKKSAVRTNSHRDKSPPIIQKVVPEHHHEQQQQHDPQTDADDHVMAVDHDPHSFDEEAEKEEQEHEKKQEQQQVEIDPKTALVLAKHGTGPTKLGYVVDLVYERQHPSFRQLDNNSVLLPTSSYYTETEQKVAGLVGEETSVKSCEYVQDRRLHIKSKCRDTETPLMAYNSASFPRTLCGIYIAPNSAVKLEEHSHCLNDEAVHLFPQDVAPISGHGMPPIVVQSQPGLLSEQVLVEADNREKIDCDIPCEFETNIKKGNDRFVAGTNWKLTQTTADPSNVYKARVERTAFRQDEYYSTTSFKSDVPLSFYSFDKYNLQNARPPIDWNEAGNKATYLLDEQCHAGRRNKWYAAVEAAFTTEAYGSCHHNTDVDSNNKHEESIQTLQGRIQLAKKNRIHLAFQASSDKDRIEELVWESLLSGAVPAILGAPNLEQYLPGYPKKASALLALGYGTWDKFAQAVKQVSENKTLWESYHAWRNDEKALQAFEKRFNFTRTSPECRTCRWAYAKKYGLGWDHEQQVVTETHIPRRLCLDDSNQLVTKPFRESWVLHGTTTSSTEPGKAGSESCQKMTSETSVVESDGYKIDRTVMQHDGVTDMVITNVARESSSTSTDRDVILRLLVDVRNSEGAYFPNTHALVPALRNPLVSSASVQDENSKVTVLANWETEIYSPKQGIVEVVVQRKKGEPIGSDDNDKIPRRIRIITEDVNVLHDKMTEFFPSSFGKHMVKDFVDPIELFYAEI